MTVGGSFVIKFDFAGQLFATEYEPAGNRTRATVPEKALNTHPGSIHWIGPLKKTLKLLVDRLVEFG